MSLMSLIYVHIGDSLPEYIYHSIYQSLLINKGTNMIIYVILDDTYIPLFKQTISEFNLSIDRIICISTKSLDSESIHRYMNLIETKFKDCFYSQFRNGFWISTTLRFFYIHSLIKKLNLNNVFHIENDVMIYSSIETILYEVIKNKEIYLVKDSPNRVIPSIIYFPNEEKTTKLIEYIIDYIGKTSEFKNDMDILGSYQDCDFFPLTNKEYIFDGAAYGQYLGGIDHRNLQIYNKANSNEKLLIEYNNPSVSFINETSFVKPNDYLFIKKKVVTDHHTIPLNIYICRENGKVNLSQVANLHIHSKQLYQFSSIFDNKFTDIITGDRILSLCDFVILTDDIYNYHKNIEKYISIDRIIKINNTNIINVDKLNTIFKYYIKERRPIKLFIYTHILDVFIKKILDKLSTDYKYIIYLHNSDHTFDNTLLLESNKIQHVYAQNVNVPLQNKLTLLPIGIANSMWNHGDLLKLFTVMKNSYLYKKTKNIYVNINPNTYSYRKVLLDKFKETNCYTLSSGKEYIEYLKELAQHRFCLCIRGNGEDTHRLWESIYVGSVPVFINNKATKMDNHINYFRQLDLPFVEIKDDDLDLMCKKWNDTVFDEALYQKILNKINIYNLDALKISNYIYKEDL